MAKMLFANNAATTLASGITNVATSLTVATGTGALFPSPSAGSYFYLTLANTAGTVEIVKCTARTTDTMTVTRAQDGTAAVAWNSGDKAEQRVVAADLNNFGQLDSANTWASGQTFVAPVLGTPASGALTNCTFPTLNQNTSGTAAGLSATLVVGSGGTGAATLAANNVLLGNGTSALQVVAPGTSGNVLTSNGSTWASTTLPTSSTLLGTLNTTSGTSVVLSGLTLTGYKKIYYEINGVRPLAGGTTGNISITDPSTTVLQITQARTLTTDKWTGIGWIDLTSGILLSTVTGAATTAPQSTGSVSNYICLTTFSTATTSFTFSLTGTASTFSIGTISIYGVK